MKFIFQSGVLSQAYNLNNQERIGKSGVIEVSLSWIFVS